MSAAISELREIAQSQNQAGPRRSAMICVWCLEQGLGVKHAVAYLKTTRPTLRALATRQGFLLIYEALAECGRHTRPNQRGDLPALPAWLRKGKLGNRACRRKRVEGGEIIECGLPTDHTYCADCLHELRPRGERIFAQL